MWHSSAKHERSAFKIEGPILQVQQDLAAILLVCVTPLIWARALTVIMDARGNERVGMVLSPEKYYIQQVKTKNKFTNWSWKNSTLPNQDTKWKALWPHGSALVSRSSGLVSSPGRQHVSCSLARHLLSQCFLSNQVYKWVGRIQCRG